MAAGVSWLILSPTPCPLPPREREKRCKPSPDGRVGTIGPLPLPDLFPSAQRGEGLGTGGLRLRPPSSFNPRHGCLLRE